MSLVHYLPKVIRNQFYKADLVNKIDQELRVAFDAQGSAIAQLDECIAQQKKRVEETRELTEDVKSIEEVNERLSEIRTNTGIINTLVERVKIRGTRISKLQHLRSNHSAYSYKTLSAAYEDLTGI